MENFEYYTPTKVAFGRGVETEAGNLAKEFGFKKALVHFGSERVRYTGLLQRVCASLDNAGIEWVEFGGVVPNPRLSTVNEGVELCKKEACDFVMAVGGGSVIDSAKAIGYGVANEGDVWDFYSGKRRPKGCLPVGVVLTIAAAGSEMSESSVVTKDQGGLKRGCSSDYSRPKFALMNPELTSEVPTYETACGCVDILMHTFERYFNRDSQRELIDSIGEALCRTVIKNALILTMAPQNYEARAEIMWAGSLSHNGLTGGRNFGDWACHQLEHELSGMFDVAHGAGLAALWGAWARYALQESPGRFAKFARNIMQIESAGSDEDVALIGIEAFEVFLKSLGMPISISGLGISLTDDQIEELAYKCSFGNTRTIGEIKELNIADMANIYRLAR